ncbi:uncharacterized protein LOC111619327 [Centruroides sculpturatus]|uniref:uncharacterized protein LOC111619327 n=1 Tax=Centruroides sculpturatus TaxID=218467 RepID=UPI000C6E7E33|nr:uncharacterized protein LOC111619327 [Centruroides sculpturatus]
MTLLNASMSFFLYVEEFFLICLVLPWVPSYRLGELLNFAKRFRLPLNLTFTMYFTFSIVFIVVNIVALELHVLQVNEMVRNSFDTFKWNLFHALKFCIIIHRVLSLSMNEASLRKSTKSLEANLKTILEDKNKEVSKDDKEIQFLKEELQRTKNELNTTKNLLANYQSSKNLK